MNMFIVFLAAAGFFLLLGKISSRTSTEQVSPSAGRGSGKNYGARGRSVGRDIPSSSKYIR